VVNGEWLYTGSNVRPQVKLTFEVNPTYTVTVSYPQPQRTCVSEPSAAVGDLVWLDTNMNGLQDTGENGRANVPVNLLDSSMAVITSTLSDSSGRYRFKLPGAGVYYLEAFAPAGYLFSQQNQGSDDQKDSDASEISIIGPITVTHNTWDLSLDFGLFDDSVNVSLGDYIWADENLNGVQDSGEPGLPGVLVNLYRDVNDNGILEDGDTYLRSRVTDATGFYRFASLPTDDYLVHVDASNFLPGAALEDYTNTSGLEDPDDYNDTDDNGVLVTNLTGGYASKAATVLPWTVGTATSNGNGQVFFPNLVPGTDYVGTPSLGGYLPTVTVQGEPTKVSDLNPDLLVTSPVTVTSSGAQQTIGVWSSTPGTTKPLAVLKPAQLGNLVWNDRNGDGLQEGSEPGIRGVAVRLYTVARELLSTDVTDASSSSTQMRACLRNARLFRHQRMF